MTFFPPKPANDISEAGYFWECYDNLNQYKSNNSKQNYFTERYFWCFWAVVGAAHIVFKKMANQNPQNLGYFLHALAEKTSLQVDP